jgi:hypothetical protein
MANNVLKVNSIAIASIAKINGQTDADLAKINGEEFTSALPDARELIQEEVNFTNETTVSFDTSVSTAGNFDYFMFQFINIHSDSDAVTFRFASSDSSDYNWASFWIYYQNEAGSSASGGYNDSYDTLLNANTPLANISYAMGDVAHEALSGYLTMYGLQENSSSRQQAKHWFSQTAQHSNGDYHIATHNHGIIVHDGTNANDSIDQIDFSMSSGTFDGTIRLFGMQLS